MANSHAEHGGQFFDDIGVRFDHLKRRSEIINADVLDAWYDPSPSVANAIRENLEWLIKTSPPTHSEGLCATISEARGVPVESVLPGGGSSQLIYSALPKLLRENSKALILEPTYGEYAHLFEKLLHLPIQKIQLLPESDFEPDWDSLLRSVEDVDFVGLVNPNSPTGKLMSAQNVLRVLDQMKPGAILWLDETYIDFAEVEHSLEREAVSRTNLIVCKSMSKYYALSGLRVGYLVAHPTVIHRIEPLLPPWSVGLIAQVAAVHALQDVAYYQARAAETRELRRALAAAISSLPAVRVHDSAANFLLVELFAERSAAVVAAKLRLQGVHVRNCASLGANMGDRFVRIAVKCETDNQRITAALRDALK